MRFLTRRFLSALSGLILAGLQAGSASAQSENTAPPAYKPLPIHRADVEEIAAPFIQVAPIPDSLREEFRIHPFYQKHVVVRGIPVIGAEEVSDYAFLECAWTLDHMIPTCSPSGRPPTTAAARSNSSNAQSTSPTVVTIGNITFTAVSRAVRHTATS